MTAASGPAAPPPQLGARNSPSDSSPGSAFRVGADGAEVLQFPEDLIERLAADELHGVVAQAVLLADFVDGHNVGVMQLGGGPGLAAETRHQPGVLSSMAEQDLQ